MRYLPATAITAGAQPGVTSTANHIQTHTYTRVRPQPHTCHRAFQRRQISRRVGIDLKFGFVIQPLDEGNGVLRVRDSTPAATTAFT